MRRLRQGPGRPITFRFDGTSYVGQDGDTLASALMANGVDVIGRSLYLDRPRGVLSCGAEEPNALVTITRATSTESNVPATVQELYDGLEASSATGRPRLLPAGDSARYDKAYWHCDVAVIGAGPAGLEAAEAAADDGSSVVLLDEQASPGGGLLTGRPTVGGRSGAQWAAERVDRLRGRPGVRVMARTTAVAFAGDGVVIAVQRRTDHLARPPADRSRQRLWHLCAERVVLATGACERPLVFADNDRVGVMLAGAARQYVTRYGVAPGDAVSIFTTDDSAYEAAADLHDAGVAIVVIVDARPVPGERALALTLDRGLRVETSSVVAAAEGDPRVTGVFVRRLDESPSDARHVPCDTLAVSGGWAPSLQLYAQAGGTTRYDSLLACHVPEVAPAWLRPAGAARGLSLQADCLADGRAAGSGLEGVAPETTGPAATALWRVPGCDSARSFVDLQRDATVADIERAVGAGLRFPEHVKRYTTIGTGVDQGKTSFLNVLGIIAELTGQSLADLPATRSRPPVIPMSFALLAGRDRGTLLDPERVTAVHDWHVDRGAVFEDVGQWKRPWYYPRDDETMDAAVARECVAVRTGVGVMDASTLGKIDVQGPDAGEFLDRVYTNLMSSVPVGACRYGVICRVDGMVFDDGVVMRLADDRFVTTTTTGNAAAVLEWMEEWLQTEWPDLRVRLTSVTEQWVAIAIAGPRSREVVAQVVPDLDVSNAGMPFMALREAAVAGVPGRVARVSFSGELAFELHVPADFGTGVWERVWEAGQEAGITAYGTETMHVLRAEKGFIIVGQDTDGTVTPQDLGMHWVVSKKKDFFVGRRSHRRPDTVRVDRRQLVGLLPEDPHLRLVEGASIVTTLERTESMRTAGHVTSSYDSPSLGRTFALALVESGAERIGQSIGVLVGDTVVRAEITSTVFYDPEGTRRDG